MKTGESNLYLIDVVPIVPMRYSARATFSYLSPEGIPFGSLVMVPFGPREIRGVAILSTAIAEPPHKIPLKQVSKVISPGFLTKAQWVLAQSLSQSCLTPVGKTLRHFLPPTVKTRKTLEKKHKEGGSEKSTPLRLSKEEKALAEKVLSASELPAFLEASTQDTLRILAGAMRQVPKKKQSLILVPEILMVDDIMRSYGPIFKADRIVILHSRLSPGAVFSAWEEIRSHESCIVVGTRQALFAPFRTLGLVALLEDGEGVGYKQWDMSPRYDGRVVAEELARLHGANLVFSGESARSERALRMQEGTLARLRKENRDTPVPETVLVDMREERFKKNHSLFSERLKAEIRYARKYDGNVLLLAARLGSDVFSVCESCKHIPRCPDCDRALKSSQDGHFLCPSCAYRTKEFPRCEKCGSLSFKNVGSGTEKIEREAKRFFPDTKVVRLEESVRKKKTPEGNTEGLYGKSGIIIGTASLLHLSQLPKIRLIAIMDAENFLVLPDYQSDERFLRIVSRSKSLLSREKGGMLLVQAFHPEREIFQSIRNKAENAFLEKTEKDRKALGYPPHYSFFRIGFRDKDEKALDKTVKEAHQRLSKVIENSSFVRVSAPQKPLNAKKRGRHERMIVISVKRGEAFPKEIPAVLFSLSADWVFDPDPLSLI